ncbi:unnamed protein product [Closterium sp. NIES-64]|nr:unnamed protein product [Closterium sp. NIES-64]
MDLILLDLTLDRLPHGMGRLPCLRTLSLDVGDLFHLPPSVYLVTALKHLALENTSAPHSLPEDLGQMTALETLSLSKLSQLSNLPASLGNLTSLKELKIAKCIQLAQLPDSISRMSSLELLEIFYCCNLTELPHGMGDGLRSLRGLKLLECKALICLPPSFSSLSSLETLKIRRATSLHGTLPGGLARSTGLKKLSLSSLPHLTALPASLPATARNLTKLVLLSCKQITALLEEIGRLGALEKLRLSDLPDLKSLPRSLCQLQRLKSLKVSFCSALQSLFGNELLGAAGDVLEERSTLLRLGGEAHNSFSCGRSKETGEIGISCLPIDCCKLSSLEELSLHKCEQLALLPTANLDEGERVVGGSEQENEGVEEIGEEDGGSEGEEGEGSEREGSEGERGVGSEGEGSEGLWSGEEGGWWSEVEMRSRRKARMGSTYTPLAAAKDGADSVAGEGMEEKLLRKLALIGKGLNSGRCAWGCSCLLMAPIWWLKPQDSTIHLMEFDILSCLQSSPLALLHPLCFTPSASPLIAPTSGGYSLKAGPGSMIHLMKFEMGGAAAVLGAAKAIAAIQPQGVQVTIPCHHSLPANIPCHNSLAPVCGGFVWIAMRGELTLPPASSLVSWPSVFCPVRGCQFVAEGLPWAHLDIAGPVWSEKKGRGTGFGASLLYHSVASHSP